MGLILIGSVVGVFAEEGRMKCEDYTYSNCPKSCERNCVSSSCEGDVCVNDCEGAGSCFEKKNFEEFDDAVSDCRNDCKEKCYDEECRSKCINQCKKGMKEDRNFERRYVRVFCFDCLKLFIFNKF